MTDYAFPIEPITDPLGRELWLPSDMKLSVCCLCSRFMVSEVPIHHRERFKEYNAARMLPERAARRHEGRPQCRECLEYSSIKRREVAGDTVWQRIEAARRDGNE